MDDGHITEQDKVIVSMLSKKRLLNMIRFFVLYDSGIKKVARYQQFFGVENTMRRTTVKMDAPAVAALFGIHRVAASP